MKLSAIVLGAALVAFVTRICSAGEPLIVNDLFLIPSVPHGLASGTVTANFADSWGELEFVAYTPGYGAGPELQDKYYEPTWDPNTQLFQWDATGSPDGDYIWRVTGYSGGLQDVGDIAVSNMIIGEVPEITGLNFQVDLAAGYSGMLSGVVTATGNVDEWSELLYPSYKSSDGAQASDPMGINDPTWDSQTQEFGWNVSGAAPRVYTWHVHAFNSAGGRNAGEIVVRVLVPEPDSAVSLLAAVGVIAAFANVPGIARSKSKRTG